MQSEEWREIPGWPYEASSLGRIRRFGKKEPRLLQDGGRGYLQLHLSQGKFNHGTHPVHRLVAQAFLGPRPPAMQINHIDGDKKNNRPGNLEYVTHQYNVRHAKSLGLDQRGERNGMVKHTEKRPRGESQGMSKLKAEQVIQIRGMLASGEKQTDIAKIFSIDPATVSHIYCGRTWSWL